MGRWAAASDPEDCSGCRLTGTATCYGVAAYSMYQRTQVPLVEAHALRNRRFLVFFAGVWAAAGTYRLLM